MRFTTKDIIAITFSLAVALGGWELFKLLLKNAREELRRSAPVEVYVLIFGANISIGLIWYWARGRPAKRTIQDAAFFWIWALLIVFLLSLLLNAVTATL